MTLVPGLKLLVWIFVIVDKIKDSSYLRMQWAKEAYEFEMHVNEDWKGFKTAQIQVVETWEARDK